MPVVGHDRTGEDRDRRGSHERVERLSQPERRDRPHDIEMRAHRGGMDPGIGAPGGVDRNVLAGNPVPRDLDRLLHARPVRLALPAHERPAVIFDGQRETRHASRVPAGITKPRSSSDDVMTPRPARCSEVGRITPSPVAMPSPSSITVPAAPSPGSTTADNMRIRSPRYSKNAPGAGLNARTCRSMTSAGAAKSIIASALAILAA